jgi:ribosomal protein S18 acetylase RimI-like enzyme
MELNQSDILDMRSLLQQSGNELDIADFYELIALEKIQANMKIWRNQAGYLIAFAFVDDFNNLCFALDENNGSEALEIELVDWGEKCIRQRRFETGDFATLDASSNMNNLRRLKFLEKHGFQRINERTLHYERCLLAPIPRVALPDRCYLRSAQGEEQAESLAALHRAAFGTEHMTLEYRLSMMRVPNYDPDLDIYIDTSSGEPLAFCICSIAKEENERDGSKNGYTDPIGVHPHYQGQGFGAAALLAGLQALQKRGLDCAKLGTSSENLPMQRLAESVGFRVVSEKIWFTKAVN